MVNQGLLLIYINEVITPPVEDGFFLPTYGIGALFINSSLTTFYIVDLLVQRTVLSFSANDFFQYLSNYPLANPYISYLFIDEVTRYVYEIAKIPSYYYVNMCYNLLLKNSYLRPKQDLFRDRVRDDCNYAVQYEQGEWFVEVDPAKVNITGTSLKWGDAYYPTPAGQVRKIAHFTRYWDIKAYPSFENSPLVLFDIVYYGNSIKVGELFVLYIPVMIDFYDMKVQYDDHYSEAGDWQEGSPSSRYCYYRYYYEHISGEKLFKVGCGPQQLRQDKRLFPDDRKRQIYEQVNKQIYMYEYKACVCNDGSGQYRCDEEWTNSWPVSWESNTSFVLGFCVFADNKC